MNYGEVRAQFMGTLNRRDITPSQVEAYLKQGIQRAQRLLRVPADEATYISTVGANFQTLPIPGDYLKMVSLLHSGTCGDTELTRVNLEAALDLSKHTGRPSVYARQGATWVIGPAPSAGSKFTLVYHSDFTTLTNPTDNNWLTEVAPDVIINGALSAACRFYVDPRRDGYEADFLQAITDLNIQASDDELLNAAVGHSFYFDD